LPELRRLEREEAEVDPTRRAARRVPDQENERDHRRRADEDAAPVAAVEIRVDERREHEHDTADGCVEDLAIEVVAGIVRDDELRVVRRTIAAPPRLVQLARVARKTDGLLRGARLAGDRVREVAEDAERRPVRIVRRLEEALLDDLDVGTIETRDRSPGRRRR